MEEVAEDRRACSLDLKRLLCMSGLKAVICDNVGPGFRMSKTGENMQLEERKQSPRDDPGALVWWADDTGV